MADYDLMEAVKKAYALDLGMSQSQFEAIRAANNEEFAASGFIHFGKHRNVLAGAIPVNNGMWQSPSIPNILKLGFPSTGSGVLGNSKTDYPIINCAGVIFHISALNYSVSGGENDIKFPSAPDGKTTYNKSTGAIVTHADSTTAFAAQQADPTNVEVVTDRVDMWGFEAWLEEVNSTNPFVYPNGLIQSQATTMDGITTSASARPVTYYAVFDGDTSSKGKGVNFFTLTDAQKKKVLGNHKNNLYYLDDGRLVQWRLRQRSFAGAGNGDWAGINSETATGDTADRFLLFSSGGSYLAVQGHGQHNTLASGSFGKSAYAFAGRNAALKPNQNNVVIGAWTCENIGAAVNGECYFIVCGTVNRLNSGFYHPSLNANGSAKALGDTFWHNTAQSFTSTADCFNPAKLLTDSGSIASGKSGRPSGENQYFDAIYASGFGGVCRDMRYSAYGLTPTDFADADQRVKNGTYRGFEKAVFTKFDRQTGSTNASQQYINVSDLTGYYIGQKIHVEVTAGSYQTFTVKGITYGALSIQLDRFAPRLQNGIMLVEKESPSSIGGSFLQTTQYGNPSALLQAFPNGWQGDWSPTVPSGAISAFPLTRKALAAPTALRSTNNGSSWTAFTPTFDAVKNEVTLTNEPATNIVILQYQAFAKQTKPSANAVVYGGQSGVGGVYVNSYGAIEYSALLGESLAGKICIRDTGGGRPFASESTITSAPILSASGKFDVGNWLGNPQHTPLLIAAPTNNSPAFKALNYNVAVNQQGFINYAYTELKHNGTNWGDDSKVTIVDNQSTKTDLNGNTVLVGTAQLNESIGWIKNKV